MSWLRRVAGLAPSWRSLIAGFVLAGLAAGAYLAARETSVFAVRSIEVRGAPPQVAAQVRTALAPLEGRSLLKIGGADVRASVGTLTSVSAASYDRAFPHTLRVYVRAEEPLAVLRRGAEAWLVSIRGRVVRSLPNPRLSSLPRIWVPADATVTEGAALADDEAARAVRALAPLRGSPFLQRVRDVRATSEELTMILRAGLEVRLGDASNILLKLAVSWEIVPRLAPPGYLDVSVPERPVASANPQLEG